LLFREGADIADGRSARPQRKHDRPASFDASRPAPGRINMFASERLVQPVELACSFSVV
jgi:hypothetical protein